MTLGQQLALMRPWWMWKEKEIQDALRVAKLNFCLPAIDEALQENRDAGRQPASIKDLADPRFLDRDPRNIERMEDGTYALTDQHLLGISVSLKIPLAKLLPPTEVWIEMAACELCNPGLNRKEARAYAMYVTGRLAASQNPIRDSAAIKRICQALPDQFASEKEVETAIMTAAQCVGTILERFQGKTK